MVVRFSTKTTGWLPGQPSAEASTISTTKRTSRPTSHNRNRMAPMVWSSGCEKPKLARNNLVKSLVTILIFVKPAFKRAAETFYFVQSDVCWKLNVQLLGEVEYFLITGTWLGSVWIWYVTPDMQSRSVNVSAYLLKTSLDRVSTCFTRPSSSDVPSPSTLDTLSTTSNSMGLNLFLC